MRSELSKQRPAHRLDVEAKRKLVGSANSEKMLLLFVLRIPPMLALTQLSRGLFRNDAIHL